MYTIFDTGASNIYISDIYFEDFIGKFFTAHSVFDFKVERGDVTASCGEYGPVDFLINGHWLTLMPNDYYY